MKKFICDICKRESDSEYFVKSLFLVIGVKADSCEDCLEKLVKVAENLEIKMGEDRLKRIKKEIIKLQNEL